MFGKCNLTAIAYGLAGGFGALVIAGCTTATVSRHGFAVEQDNPAEIQPGLKRQEVLSTFGSPSTTGLLDDNTWIYHSYSIRNVAFLRPKLTDRTLVLVQFDAEEQVSDVLTYDINDGEVIRFASLETPAPGRQRSLLERLLGSVGIRPDLGNRQVDPDTGR